MAVIDCTPTDLHDGKTLGEMSNERTITRIKGKHTSGIVDLIYPEEGEDKDDRQRGLVRTSSIIITSGKIQVRVLAIVRATVVPPRDPVGGGQLSTPLGFIEEQAISEER